jgi:hypothetical protein
MRHLLFALALLFVTPAAAQDQGKVVASCGSVTLKAGTQAFRTLNLQGQTCNSGGGTTGICSQATNYLVRTTGGNAGGNASAITSLICGLVNDGVWGKLDVMYVLAQQNAADARLNLVSANFGLPAGGTFTAYKGISAFPTGGLDTGFDPGTGSGHHFVAGNSGLQSWAFDPVTTNSVSIGTNNEVGGSYIVTGFNGLTNTLCSLQVTGGGDAYFPAQTTAGLFACDRPSPSSVNFYFNGTPKGPISNASVNITPRSFRIGDIAGGLDTTSTTISEASVSSALGDAGQAALYNRLHTYMAAAGTGCPEADAYLVRAPGETAHSADLVALICGLVADGTWAKLDALYLLAQQTQADARLNLVSASYPLVGTATFVPYQGFSAFTTPALDTGFNPGTAVGAHLQPSDGFIGAWSYGVPDWTVLQMGASTNPGGIAIAANYGGGSQYYCYIGYATPPFNTPPSLPGFYSCDKGDASNVVLYYNDAPSGPTQNQGTVAFPSANMYVGSAALLSASVATVSEVNFGASIGAVRQAALYARLRSYMTAVGVP